MADYTLNNTDIAIRVNSVGAELCSLKSGGYELLWEGKKEVWPRQAPVLFPIVGKLKNDTASCNGHNITLPQHGFARDREFRLVGQDESSLEFELTADEDSLKFFPFHFSLIIRYELKGTTVYVTYRVFNPDNPPLFFSIGAHPGFNCRRVPGESLSDFILEFEQDNLVAEKLDNGLQSGKTYALELRNKQLSLNSMLFDNDAIVLKDGQVDSVNLFSVKGSIAVKVSCKDWPYFGVWSKKGSDEFVCLEPWYGITDSVNSSGDFTGKAGIIRLEPFNSFEASYSIEIINKNKQ